MFKVSTLAKFFNFSMFNNIISSYKFLRCLHWKILNAWGLYTCKFFNFSMFKVSSLAIFSMFKVSTLANSSIFQCLRSLHFNFSMFKVSSRSLHLQILQFFNVQGLYTCKFFNFFNVQGLYTWKILNIVDSYKSLRCLQLKIVEFW